VDQYQAETFARMVQNMAVLVQRNAYKEDISENDLIAGAVQGLYEEVGLPVPDATRDAIRQAKNSIGLMALMTAARVELGNRPALAGTRSMFAALNGFRHATDSLTAVVSPRLNSYASVDQEFGIGIELEGVTPQRWAVYQAENAVASGRYTSVGYFGQPPRPNAVPCPATLPWRVKRVVPGSPAQKAGVKPGDRIVSLDQTEITADTANRVFAGFAVPRLAFDPVTGRGMNPDRDIAFERDGGKAFTVTLKSNGYEPEGAFGVMRQHDDTWDCMLDRKAKIGYIRITAIEHGLDGKIEEMMADLMKQDCRALILDLRWCPGGYVDPGKRISGMFLKENTVIAKMLYRDSEARSIGSQGGDQFAPVGTARYPGIPLAILVGQETVGGGELIASALRDNDRCVVIGQRTFGRAAIQNTFDAGFAGMQFKLSTGTSLRPNGKSRERKPDSKPTDDWGIRPDAGLEVPVTLDKSQELRREAELHALRLFNSREALPFDDPNQDPYRLAALVYFRKKLEAGN
jgi:C-terminal processing protease CtpA/Prc